MALIVYFGVGLVTHKTRHIVVDVVTLRLPERCARMLGLVTNVLSLGFLAVMVWRLWLQANFLFAKGDTTMVWNVPLWPVAFAVAAGSIFLLTGVVLHLLACLGVGGATRSRRLPTAGARSTRIAQPPSRMVRSLLAPS